MGICLPSVRLLCPRCLVRGLLPSPFFQCLSFLWLVLQRPNWVSALPTVFLCGLLPTSSCGEYVLPVFKSFYGLFILMWLLPRCIHGMSSAWDLPTLPSSPVPFFGSFVPSLLLSFVLNVCFLVQFLIPLVIFLLFRKFNGCSGNYFMQ